MKTINFREFQRNPVQRVFFVPITRIVAGRNGEVIIDYDTHKESVKVHDDDVMAVHAAIQRHEEHKSSVRVLVSNW